MEEKKGNKISLFSVVLILLAFILTVGIVFMYLQNQKLNEKLILREGAINNPNASVTEQMNGTVTKTTNSESSSNSGYSDNELIEMVRNYRKSNGMYVNNIVIEKEITTEDGNVVAIRLYDDLEDHTTTTDWYYINRLTGKGTNFLGESVDLNSSNNSNNSNKIDESKGIIYTVSKTVKDNDGKDKKIDIPQFNLNYDNTKKINQKIIEDTSKFATGTDFLPEFEYHEKDNVVSLYISISTEASSLFEHIVYNINKITGKQITNEELWKLNGITGKDVINRIELFAKQVADEIKSEGLTDFSLTAGSTSAYEYGTRGNNFDIYDLHMFLNKNGKISMILESLKPVGGFRNTKIVEL